jgi:hypothetical protein
MFSKIEQLIQQKYDEKKNQLDLSNLGNADAGDWLAVISHRDWQMLRRLSLSKCGITEGGAVSQMKTSKLSLTDCGQI